MIVMNRIIHATTALALVTIFSFLSGPAQAGLEEGVTAYQTGDLPLAIKEFSTVADTGNADGHHWLTAGGAKPMSAMGSVTALRDRQLPAKSGPWH
ncbi:hypothetical protein SOP85_16960 [Pseudomonas sp. YuFO20]|uniref:hypothetical protein n=1 Tax=Pseudomonas sp. YuFO20 TaxID=3095362 RepID=UPI002B24775B|nr:hypothetical protein [Pseudomonas sp. YuFO20]MEB2517120.1 hypothetical protein [Pseudomonas sp. YuFO20]